MARQKIRPIFGYPLALLLTLIVLFKPATSWPADHINSLSDIRCRHWCSFRFREGLAQLFRHDANTRRRLQSDTVRGFQDSRLKLLKDAMQENRQRFRAFYREAGLRNVRYRSDARDSQMLGWFNLYQEYLHCLIECFEGA